MVGRLDSGPQFNTGKTFLREAFNHWYVPAGLAIVGWMVILSAYVWAGKPVGNVPVIGGNTIQQVPASGDAGFPVLAFCQDPLTTVTKGIAPPDSMFVANYTLDRHSITGVHEVVTVGVYADPNKQPVGTHYDSANHPTDANVTKDALACIEGKAK